MHNSLVGSLSLVLFAGLIVGTLGAEVTDRKCTKTPTEANPSGIVHSISVEPCDAAPGGPCVVTRGNNVTFTMDWEPSSRITRKMRHSYSWERPGVDLPLQGMNPRACKFTDCKKQTGIRRRYQSVIELKRSMPPGTYPVKVKLYEKRTVYACQMVDITLV